MSVQLLDKTRKINTLLHRTGTEKIIFSDVCEILSSVLGSNILIVSKRGKLLGVKCREEIQEITEFLTNEVGNTIDLVLNERILNILSTKENVNLMTLGFEATDISNYQAIVTPIDVSGERLGTVFAYRKVMPYQIDDIILSEYGATVVGLEMMRAVTDEKNDAERKVSVVRAAFNTLSHSELEAISHVFKQLDGMEGMLVASKIADSVGITRSVIVNALRKLESAGVIEARSSGMKGTYLRVINDVIFDELEKIDETL
jgi:transcriptional pleiotropic repressor